MIVQGDARKVACVMVMSRARVMVNSTCSRMPVAGCLSCSSRAAKGMMPSREGRTVYAANSKAKGKVHRVTADTARLPHHQQRVACGWRIKQSTSIVYYSRRLKWGTFCRKCFPNDGMEPNGEGVEQLGGDVIEQFAGEEAPGEHAT